MSRTITDTDKARRRKLALRSRKFPIGLLIRKGLNRGLEYSDWGNLRSETVGADKLATMAEILGEMEKKENGR